MSDAHVQPPAGGSASSVEARLAEWAERDATIGLRRELASLRIHNEDLQVCVGRLQNRAEAAEAEAMALRRELRSSVSGRLWYPVGSALRAARRSMRRR